MKNLARLGGDEFVTFLFIGNTKELEKIAQESIREVFFHNSCTLQTPRVTEVRSREKPGHSIM